MPNNKIAPYSADLINTFDSYKKTFEERLEEIKLSPDEESEIIKSSMKDTIRDKALGFFKFGEIISEIINWNESVDKDVKERKQKYLISQYFNKSDEHDEALKRLKEFITNPQGNTLYNKIVRIMDNSPPDQKLGDHLSSALSYIVNSDFISLFEKHKYNLSLIEQTSPQGMAILCDSKKWPIFILGTLSAIGGRVTTEWVPQFTLSYVKEYCIYNNEYISRIQHSINQLYNNKLVEAYVVSEIKPGDTKTEVRLTTLGESFANYLSTGR